MHTIVIPDSALLVARLYVHDRIGLRLARTADVDPAPDGYNEFRFSVPEPRDDLRDFLEDDEDHPFASVQRQVKLWSAYNFGDRPAWQPLVGISEEFGEYHDAKTIDDRLDAVADIGVFLCDFANAVDVNVDEAVGVFERGVAAESRRMAETMPLRATTAYIGRMCHAFLKHAQGIRTDEPHTDRLRFAIGALGWVLRPLTASAVRITSRDGTEFGTVLLDVWREVRARDWILYPDTKGRPPEPAQETTL